MDNIKISFSIYIIIYNDYSHHGYLTFLYIYILNYNQKFAFFPRHFYTRPIANFGQKLYISF